ncbi:ABC transporter ATP-binding protein [Streptomyces sp. NBC_01244]|uniref:ABC transporter ATP-binding protein n=1 Tax=Streptomyces sp. NBC_01244 TaxID=2903797 RepID=UPI002E14765D|nr:ABC transporter ATP-binding protein/permease [Streptomyces sp. NBC_01244]
MSAPDDSTHLPVADAPTVRRACLDLVRSDLWAVIRAVLLICLAAAAGLAGPWLLGRITTEVQTGLASVSRIDVLAGCAVAAALAQLVFSRFAHNQAHRLAERALARLREEVIDRALALPARIVDQVGKGDLLTRASMDVTTVASTLRDAVPGMAMAVVQVLFIYGAVFLLQPLLGLCALAGLPVIVWASRWYLARARTGYLAQGAVASEVTEILSTTAQGGRTVEVFGLEAQRVEAAERALDTAYRASRHTLFLRSVLFPAVEFAHFLPITATLLAGGTAYLHGNVELGVVVACTLYMWQLVDPLNRILSLLEDFQGNGASLARIKGISAAAQAETVRVPEPAGDGIELKDVRYAYVEGHDVLTDVSLSIRPGERLALVGPSGAGKSTLGRLIAGMDAPRTGSVLVGGVPVAGLAASNELGGRIVLVTQEHHVFMGTLRDNLSMAAPDAGDERLLAALALVGADWVDELPEGLDTRFGPGALSLDPARAQQLSLARVELADPHTLVLDEATALLDPGTARRTEQAMAAVRADRTVITIAHRLQTAYDADRVAVVDAGRIVELGSHDALLAEDGAYAALWRSWNGSPESHDVDRVS